MKLSGLSVILFVLFLFLYGCVPTQVVRELNSPDRFTANSKAKYLKVHIKDGSLFILNNWVIDTITEVIQGSGNYFNYKREKVSLKNGEYLAFNNTTYTICWDDISLIETNQLLHHVGNIAAITIPGVPYAVLATYCVINPKACFGSCPTFYTKNNDKWELVAEGFSSSILPVFEKEDIDMLYQTENTDDNLVVKLTNEALETHVIRYANLLAFPKNEEMRIFSTETGEFYRIKNLLTPVLLKDKQGSSIEKVEHFDQTERYSLTDSKNLAKKEEITFSFQNPETSHLGLIISSRQTLLTTFLYYQGLAYSGNYAGYFAAGIENGNNLIKNRVEKLWDKLGSIEIYLKTQMGSWTKIGEIDEMGPIATDTHLIKLPPNTPPNPTLKLKMTQGLWRINYITLGEIGEKVDPIIIQPHVVLKEDIEDPEALQLLKDTANYLVTYPGDTYFLNYELPNDNKYEFFLQSKGYYLEWMRDEWLAEQDLKKAQFMFAFPGLFMRRAAKDFKKVEPEMEDWFWGSRYVRN